MKIDPNTLLSTAAKSEHGEAYQVIKSGENHRLGLGVTVEQVPNNFFIELLLTYCNNGTPNLTNLQKLLEKLRELESYGYEIHCEDNHSFNCTKKIEKSNIQMETEKVSKILNPISED